MTPGDRPAVVFDCTIYVQATVSTKGPAAAALNIVEAGEVALFVSLDILREVREVLTRSKLRQGRRNLTEERVDALLQNLSQIGVLVQDVPKQFAFARDPDDEPYINLAIAVGAKYLVSRDKDLLDLMNDPHFRSCYPNLTVLDPVAFLQQIKPREPPLQSSQPAQEDNSE